MKNEMTFDGVKVVVTRQHGDDMFRAVVGDGEVTLVVSSHKLPDKPRWESVGTYGGLIRNEQIKTPNDLLVWSQTLKVAARVMEYLHEEGLKYDKIVERRKRAKEKSSQTGQGSTS